jgi:DNA-binding protein
MSKKNVTNRVLAVVSSVSSSRGKPELEICNRKKRGFKVNFFLIGVILALLPVVSSASDRSVIVRDRYGNIVETKDRYGDDTTVRDRSGNIIRTEEYDQFGGKSIRDREGNIIGTEERD